MKISQIASLIVVGALVAPLAAHAEDKPAGTAKMWVKDSAITTKVKAQLATSKPSSLATVHVETDANGWVQLTGKVATQADKDRAETTAKGIEGVKSVDNQLVVTGK
jgi:hyperosmotically inducible protein